MSRRAPSSASNASATKRHRSITRPSEHPSHPARFKRPLTQCGPLIGQRLQPASPALRHKQSTRHRPPWPGLASEGDAWAVADPSACSRVISSTCRLVPDGFGSSAQRQHRHRRPARPPARHSPKGSIRRARRRQPGRHQPRDLASQVPPGNKANRPGRRRSATLAARRRSTARALAERCELFALTVGAARPGASHTGGDVGRCRYSHRRAPRSASDGGRVGRLCGRHMSYCQDRLARARRSQICGLQWRDIDFDSGRMLFTRSVVDGDQGITVKSTKSDRAYRVAVDAATLSVLSQHRTNAERLAK